MSVMIDLEPDVESELHSRAVSAGVTVTEYLSAIIRREIGQQKSKAMNLMDLAAPIRKDAQADQLTPVKLRAKNLVELGAPLRGLFSDEELDFKREPSYARDIDFS